MGNTRFGLSCIGVTSVLLLASFLLVAPVADAQTYVSGNISGTQTWNAPGPYIATGDLYVTGSLTIESGTDVLFNDGLALYVEDQLGALNVLFNENGSSVIPWKGIQFNATSANSVIVSSNITASTVGIFIDGPPQSPILTGTTIYGTGIGLIVNGTDPQISLLTVSSSSMYSVDASDSSATLENCTLEGAANDFYVGNGSHLTTLSTSFGGSVTVADAASDLTVKNYLDILVLDESMAPLQGADINVTDTPPVGPNQTVYSSSYFGGPDPQTSPSGDARWIVVTDRTYTDIGEAENLTRIEVFYPGKTFADNPRLVSMNSSHTEIFTAIGPSDPPRVLTWNPVAGGIPVSAPIEASFDKPMNRTSVELSLRYNDGGIYRDWRHGNFSWIGNDSFSFGPNVPYACCTHYNVTLLSSTAKDQLGHYLDGDDDGSSGPDFLWNFTTEAGTPPDVNNTRPFGGEMDVSVSSNIIVIFERPMDKTSVVMSFSYTNGSTVWNQTHGKISWASTNHVSDTMIFNPFSNLQTSTSYNVTINGSVAMDDCGSFLLGGSDYVWGFTTEPVDDDPPHVIGNIPQSGQTGVVIDTVIEIRFSENMDPDSVNDSFSYTDSTTTWTKSDGNVTWNMGMDVFTFQPTLSLYYGRTYRVILDSSMAVDASGNLLDGDGNGVGGDNFVFNFTAEVIPDSEPPTVVSESPVGSNVQVTSNIVVRFSELMDESSVQSAFSYTDGTTLWQEGDGDFVWNGVEVTFIPEFGLDYGTTYTVTMSQSAMDRSSNHLVNDHSWVFTTHVGLGTIRGRVRDENGVDLADVKVTIEALGVTVQTSSNGSYALLGVPAGTHAVKFSKNGFNTVTKSVDLDPEQTRELNVTMTHSLTLFDLWWMILLIIILVVVLIVVLWWRRKRAQTWPGAEDIAYIEPPEEPPPELEPMEEEGLPEEEAPDLESYE